MSSASINEIIEKLENDGCLISLSRSSGPGGQNVNKVNSKVTIKWHLDSSDAFAYWVLRRMEDKYGNRISKEGYVIVSSDNSRDMTQNRALCFEKLAGMIKAAMTVAKPRKPTKPKKAAIERRLQSKKQQSDKKKNRKKLDWS